MREIYHARIGAERWLEAQVEERLYINTGGCGFEPHPAGFYVLKSYTRI